MTFVITVILLLAAGILVLRSRGVNQKDGFQIIVCSVCLFIVGYWFVGGGVAQIPRVDQYLVRHGLIETPVEEGIYLAPASAFGVVCFWWMLRKHLSIRSSQPRPADAARGG